MISVSIVTVVYNAVKTIKKTIDSVLKQNYTNLEYWIIDGKSTDATMAVVQSYDNLFRENGIAFHYVSHSDEGIFDAMNKSLNYISGEYVLFLNAGDFFVDENVIAKIFSNTSDAAADIIYGNYYAYSNNNRKKYTALDISVLPDRMISTHQSIFTKVSLLKRRNFNVKYKMAADYDFFLEMYLEKKNFIKVEVEIVYFDISGVSQTHAALTQKEKFLIQYSQGVISTKEYAKKKKRIKYICLRKKAIQLLPKCIRYQSYENIKIE